MNGLQINNEKVRIASMVHDLKNPIAILLSNLNLVLNGTIDFGPLTGKRRNHIERALRATKTIVTYLDIVNLIMRVYRFTFFTTISM